MADLRDPFAPRPPRSGDQIAAKPPRLRLINMRTGQGVVAQFNPTDFQESIDVLWQKQPILGMSHPQQQYMGTDAHTVQLDLYFNKLMLQASREPLLSTIGVNEFAHPDDIKRFLLSLCYSRRGAPNVVGGAPSRVLVIWPGTLSMVCIVKSINIRNTRFARTGVVTEFTCAIVLEEIRDVRLTSEDVLQFGSRRPLR